MKRLQELVGCRLEEAWRVLDMTCLRFAAAYGGEIKPGLHINAMIRLRKSGRILATSLDPHMEDVLLQSTGCRVAEVCAEPAGDLFLRFEDGLTVEILVTTADEEPEMWRFLAANEDAPHLICSAHTYVESEAFPPHE